MQECVWEVSWAVRGCALISGGTQSTSVRGCRARVLPEEYRSPPLWPTRLDLFSRSIIAGRCVDRNPSQRIVIKQVAIKGKGDMDTWWVGEPCVPSIVPGANSDIG